MRSTLARLAKVAAAPPGLALTRYVATGAYWKYRMTRRHEIVETLDRPTPVLGIEDDSIILPGGRHLAIPGAPLSQSATIVAWETSRHGLELGPDGRQRGLIEVFRPSGTPRIRRHLARVPVFELVAQLEDEATRKSPGRATVVPLGSEEPAPAKGRSSDGAADPLALQRCQDPWTGAWGSAEPPAAPCSAQSRSA
ncbi:hypothetical protein Pla86_19990 [Planctomycetes bacterium Pla86]|uniref:Uncharacterized protein n=1 Tax=Engelhardtia mirabilis TaxID=2528011 RepID=A0A518BJ03_9BACT|nr:hypothetical protein Pla133_19990 [Planctomycetes bacterium Pla133]QDV01250.1 hypothetical protein Pla86_19990 [Planctomycetes bacterium Pla86]